MNNQNNIPFITTDQMREADRLMIEDYGITLIRMMENAGRNLARLAQRFLKTNKIKTILIIAGTGGNGGGALVCARYMHNWGYRVKILLSKTQENYKGIILDQLKIILKLGIPVENFKDLDKNFVASLIIDGLIGYSLRGIPKGIVFEMIQWANSVDCPILALDLPSGLDGTKGHIHEHVIKATATLTLALPKTGLIEKSSRTYVGELYLADIGVPPQLYNNPTIGIKVGNLFSESSILQIF